MKEYVYCIKEDKFGVDGDQTDDWWKGIGVVSAYGPVNVGGEKLKIRF